MTAKQKAKELYDKYEFVYIQNYTSKHEVKQCALIAVENEQEALDRFVKYWNLEFGDWYKDECLKIQEVKQEIEKL